MAEPKRQKLIMVTGKGGVGKSVSAAALAWGEAEQGKRVLLVELGDESFYKDFFQLDQVSFKPVQLAEGLDVARWSSSDCLKEYAIHLLRSENLYHLFFENVVMKTFIKVAPGLTELAILGKFTSGIRKVGPPLNYDVIVLDSYASGHTTAMLRAPRGMAQAVSIGPMGEQSRSILKVLSDNQVMNYFVVTLPEELPYQETLELATVVEEETTLKPTVICNNLLDEPLSPDELGELFKAEPAPTLKPFTRYLKNRLIQQNEILGQLRARSLKVLEVPLFLETGAWEIVKKVSERLKQ